MKNVPLKRFVGFEAPIFGGDVFCRGAFLGKMRQRIATPVEMRISNRSSALPKNWEQGP
jgi:hypothetical protein